MKKSRNKKPAVRVILVAAPPKEAKALGERLVRERLAACANLVPKVLSFYWWQGKLQRNAETLIILKTPPQNVPRLLKRVRELHSYTVPEFLALPVDAANQAYVEWANRESRP